MSSDASIHRIFILRPDNLGDLVLFSGALRHIRNHWPSAHITLCVRSYGRGLFAHCPYIDRLVSFEWLKQSLLDGERMPWLPNIRGSSRLSHWIRPAVGGWLGSCYRCDLALLPVLAPWAEYHRLLEKIPSRERWGIYGNLTNQTGAEDFSARGSYSSQMDASAFPGDFPEMEATRRFLNFIGIKVIESSIWPEFWTTPEERSVAREKLSKTNGILTLGVAPGAASMNGKTPPSEWFAQAIRESVGEQINVVLLGSTADAVACSELANALKPFAGVKSVLNLAGTTTVGELIECVRLCDVVLSPDTATLHIATTLRKPVVGIMGGWHFGRFYPWGNSPTTRMVNKSMDCYGCNWRCHYDTIRCIQEIPAEDAANQLRDLFKVVLSGA